VEIFGIATEDPRRSPKLDHLCSDRVAHPRGRAWARKPRVGKTLSSPAGRPEKLKPDEQQLLAKLNECCPEVPILHEWTQGFAHVFRGREKGALQTWLDGAYRSGLPEISRFCDGLLRDADAVTAAVVLPWSNGQVEGQIHRLKLVKRQMYGRAKFDLIRTRVLPYIPVIVRLSPERPP